MRITLAVQHARRTVRQRWAQARRLLRRQRAAVALLLLLTLGLGEPLLCIIHCQLWLPLAFHSYFAAQHRHDHQPATLPTYTAHEHHVVASDTPFTAVIESTSAPLAGCTISGGTGAVPYAVPASPVHDMIAACVVLLLVLLRVYRYLPVPPRKPPRLCVSPLLRPPIFSAA